MKFFFATACLVFLSILPTIAASQPFTFDYSLENTNIAAYRQKQRFTDDNRLRLQLQVESEKIPQLTASLKVDNNTGFNQEDSGLDNDVRLYRGYIEYATDSHLLRVGRQRIPFGVGRIWNPIDIFNPIDVTAIEPGEREGTDSLRYEYAISDLAGFDLTLAEDRWAARLKGFLGFADMALVTVIDDDRDLIIVGWELEGELASTGIELRSEGGSFYSRSMEEAHTELIIGAEYGFANSLTLLLEYSFNDDPDVDQLGIILSYQLSPLLQASILALTNLEDHSRLLAPTISYSLSDEMTLTTGFFFHDGENGTSFGNMEDMVFLKWFIHF